MSSLHPVAACVRRAARGLRWQRAQEAALLAASAALALLIFVRASAWALAHLPAASAVRLADLILAASAGLPLACGLAGLSALAAAALAGTWPIDEARLALAIDRERGLSDLFASAWEFAQVDPARQSAFVRATLERAALVAPAIRGERAPRRFLRELVWLGALVALAFVVARPLQPMAAGSAALVSRGPAATATAEPLLSPDELRRHRALASAPTDSEALAGVRRELQRLLDALEAGRVERVQALRELRALEQRTEALGPASARLERALRELARRFAAQPATRVLGQRLAGAVHGAEQSGTREVLGEGAGDAPPLEPGSAEQAHQRALDLAAARAELERLAQRLRDPAVGAQALEALRSALSAARTRPSPGSDADAAGAGAGLSTSPTPAAPSPEADHSAESAPRTDGSGPGAAGPHAADEPSEDRDLDRQSGRELERLDRDLDRAERALADAQPSAAADALERAGRELEQLQEVERAAAQAPRLRDEIAQLRESLRRGHGSRANALERPSTTPPSTEAFGVAASDAEPGAAAGESTSPEVTAQPTRVAGLAQAGPTRSQVIFGAAQPGEVSGAYARVHADYAQHAERELEREPIPPGYRLYVRRYFQLVGPSVARAAPAEHAP